MAERKERSKAWLHFTKKDDNSASCNVSKIIISSKGGVGFSCFGFQIVVGKQRGDVCLPSGPKLITLLTSELTPFVPPSSWEKTKRETSVGLG